MRLVEDHRVVVRKHRGKPGVAQSEVGKEEVVIDDDQLGALGTAAHAGHEAVFVVVTASADPRVRAADDPRPDRVFLGDFS